MKIYRPEEVTPEVLASVRTDALSPEQLKEAYALARAAFTVEDLLRFTENVEDVSAEEVLRELEETQKHFDNQKMP
jgi:hypothetical protein